MRPLRPWNRRNNLLALGILLAITGGVARAEALNTLTQKEIADGWILLFDGETTFGWEPASKADWHVADGAIVVSSGDQGLLATTSEFDNYLLKVEFRHERATNSGIFLRTPPVPKDPQSDCYELNIATEEVSPFPTGSFVGRMKGTVPNYDMDWHGYEILADGGHFVIKWDGRTVLDYTDPKPLGRGRIGLQLNAGHVEFRNIKLKPLGTHSLFNGRDLSGWKVYPGKASQFSVTPEQEIHVVNGNGQLETEKSYADFTLQLEVFSNGRGLNSGIFFRCIQIGRAHV